MILDTEILYDDELAEEECREPEFIWGKFSVDLREVVGVSEFIWKDVLYKDFAQITIRFVGERTVKKSYPAMVKLWKKSRQGVDLSMYQ